MRSFHFHTSVPEKIQHIDAEGRYFHQCYWIFIISELYRTLSLFSFVWFCFHLPREKLYPRESLWENSPLCDSSRRFQHCFRREKEPSRMTSSTTSFTTTPPTSYYSHPVIGEIGASKYVLAGSSRRFSSGKSNNLNSNSEEK